MDVGKPLVVLEPFPEALDDRAAAAHEERHVAAEAASDLGELAVGHGEPVQFAHAAQHGRRVARASAEAAAHRDALLELHPHGERAADVPLEREVRAHGEVLLDGPVDVGGARRVGRPDDRVERVAARVEAREVQVVGEVDGDHPARDRVHAVRAGRADGEREVQLRRRADDGGAVVGHG